MWEERESAVSAAAPEAVWAVWADVEHWNAWNHGVKWSRRDGPFAAGTTGKLKPKRGPSSKFEITAYEEGARWVITTFLPGARLQIEHLLATDAEGRTVVTYHGTISGPLAPVVGTLTRRQLDAVVAAVHDVAAHAATRAAA